MEVLIAAPKLMVACVDAINAVRGTERPLESATAGRDVHGFLVSAMQAFIASHVYTNACEGTDLARTWGGICSSSPNARGWESLTGVRMTPKQSSTSNFQVECSFPFLFMWLSRLALSRADTSWFSGAGQWRTGRLLKGMTFPYERGCRLFVVLRD